MKRKKFIFVIGMLIATVLLIGGVALPFLGARNFDMLTDPTAQPGETRPFWERFLENFDWNTFDFEHFNWEDFGEDFPWADLPWDEMPEDYDWNRLPWKELNDTFPWENVPWDNLPEDFDWAGVPWDTVPEDFDWGQIPWEDVPFGDLSGDFPWEKVPWDNLPEDFDWNNFPWGELPEDFDWGQIPWDNLPEDFDWSNFPWDEVPFDKLPADFPWEKVPWGELSQDFAWEKVPWDSLPEDFDWGNLPWQYLIPLAVLGGLDMPWDRIPQDAIPEGILPDGYSPWADDCEHIFTPFMTVLEPTCGDTGLMRRVCLICRVADTYVIPETGLHDFDDANLVCNNCHRRKLAISSPSAEKVYDGTPLAASTYVIDWANSAASTPGHTVIVTNETSITDVGREANRFSVIVRDSSNGNMAVDSQYAVIKTYGTLTVTRRAITVTTGSAEKVYDGEALTCNDWAIDINTPLAAGDEFRDVVFDEGQTELGWKDNVIVSYSIYHAETGTDVTKNYEVKVKYGTLTVKRK